MDHVTEDARLRRRIRRNALLLGILSALFYVGFIVATSLRNG